MTLRQEQDRPLAARAGYGAGLASVCLWWFGGSGFGGGASRFVTRRTTWRRGRFADVCTCVEPRQRELAAQVGHLFWWLESVPDTTQLSACLKALPPNSTCPSNPPLHALPALPKLRPSQRSFEHDLDKLEVTCVLFARDEKRGSDSVYAAGWNKKVRGCRCGAMRWVGWGWGWGGGVWCTAL